MTTTTSKRELSMFNKLACKLVGWNPEILKECGEASYRALRKYMSAFLILSLIWGTIGYLFAGKYIGIESAFLKGCVAAAFVSVVISIERFIILKIGKDYTTAIMRVVIALLMATLGATIFDQLIFKNDLEVAMKEERDNQANLAIERRMGILNNETVRLSLAIDSVQKEMQQKMVVLNQKPTIKTVDYTRKRVVVGKDSLNRPIYGWETQAEEKSMMNPMANQIESDRKLLENFQSQMEALTEKKLTLADDVRKEYAEAPVGFLEELKVLFRDVIMQENVALAFYLCLFFFMMSLEVLVVTSKMGEKPCDYDQIVEHQLRIKEAVMKRGTIEIEDNMEV